MFLTDVLDPFIRDLLLSTQHLLCGGSSERNPAPASVRLAYLPVKFKSRDDRATRPHGGGALRNRTKGAEDFKRVGTLK